MKRLAGICLALAMSCVVAGCSLKSDGGDPSTPTVVATTQTPTLTPSPTWTAEQQGAINAVQTYLDVWTQISQNVGTADFNEIRNVADGQLVADNIAVWTEWRNNGWFLVGAPEFTPDWVTSGAQDSIGHVYHVHGCFSIENSYLSNADGDHVGDRGVVRGPTRYDTWHLASGVQIVTDDIAEDGTC